MAKGTDVVVIGGGCAGTASAYFLSRAGLKVTLLERKALASGCSGHGTGISRLNLRDTDNPAHAELSGSHISRLAKIIPVVEDETGMDVQYQVTPGMNVPLTDEAWQKMQVLGPPAGHKVLSGDAARELEPNLGPEIPGVLWEPYRPRVAGPRLTKAYAKAAERRGATISIGETATGVEIDDGRITGVKTENGTIQCDNVVLAMGVWAPQANDWFGVKIPVKPIKGEALRLTYHGPRAQHSLSPEGLRPGFVEQGHVLFRMDGMVSIGSTMEDTGYEAEPTEAARERLMRMALYLWPALKDAEVKHQVYGLRPVPEDGLPILGPIPGVEGGYIVTGHAAVAHSALYAEITTDYVLKGRTNAIGNMEPFLMERFTKVPPEERQVFGLMRETREAKHIISAQP